jgi:hypothetical protein
MNEIDRILNDAADFVERGWCQYAMAVDALGNVVSDDDDTACAWCATGAILRASDGMDHFFPHALKALARYIGVKEVSLWNDAEARTADEVIAALRGAATRGAYPPWPPGPPCPSSTVK